MLTERSNINVENEQIPEASVKFNEIKMLLNNVKKLLGII